MTNVLNIALIGCGRAGTFHFNNIIENRMLYLSIICDNHANKAIHLSNKVFCDYTTNIEDILNNKKIEAVIIATPTPTHYEITMKCLKAKKHVFCEKPLGNNEYEIKNCFRIARENNLKLFIAYQKRFDYDYMGIYNFVKNDDPKTIRMVTKDHPIPPIEYLKTSNGIVEDMISHDIDIVNLYMGFQVPEKVIAFSYTHLQQLIEIDEIEGIEIMMQYKDGQIVTFNGSRNAYYGYDQRAEIFCCNNLYSLKNRQDNNIECFNNKNISLSKIKNSFPERYINSYKTELEGFYIMIKDDKPIVITEDQILLNKKICNAINKSLKTNQIVYLDNQLRTYIEGTPQYYLYKNMHKYQTYDYVCEKINKYSNLNNEKMSIKYVLSLMDEFIDPSDPDLDLPNSIHAYQTAERIRKKHPMDIQLQICGLIHDLGKILFKFKEPNWSVVGDTFVVGAKYADSIVFSDSLKLNPDFINNNYNTKYGIYKENCGIKNLKLSFGHDEYLYIVLNNNTHYLDDQYLDIIRFHSFYPWHTCNEYSYFMNESDIELKKDILYFNQFDLYSKDDESEITDEIKDYYSNLLDSIFPEDLNW